MPGRFAQIDDTRLARRVAEGDTTAFEVLYDRHHRALLSFCRHMLGSTEDGEDALQQTFLRAHGALRSGQVPDAIRPWLFAIARNRCLSMLSARRAASVPIDDVEPAFDGLSDDVERRVELRQLVADLGHLPDDQRAALVLFELGGLSQAEIGQTIGVPAAKVKALVFQARTELMAERDARSTPCATIREELSVARGGALRRGPLRRHLKHCEPCQAFRIAVTTQRAGLASIIPVTPALGLKAAVLAAAAGKGALTAAGAGGGGVLGGGAIGGGVSGGAASGGVLGGAGAGGGAVGAAGGGAGGILSGGAAASGGGGALSGAGAAGGGAGGVLSGGTAASGGIGASGGALGGGAGAAGGGAGGVLSGGAAAGVGAGGATGGGGALAGGGAVSGVVGSVVSGGGSALVAKLAIGAVLIGGGALGTVAATNGAAEPTGLQASATFVVETPTATPTETATPTATPTETPEPTATPRPKEHATPEPTATATPDPTAAPTRTPVPAATPASTAAPKATAVPTVSKPRTQRPKSKPKTTSRSKAQREHAVSGTIQEEVVDDSVSGDYEESVAAPTATPKPPVKPKRPRSKPKQPPPAATPAAATATPAP